MQSTNIRLQSAVKRGKPFSQLARGIQRNPWLYIMVVPMIVFLALFYFWPLTGIVIAFKRFSISNGIFGSPWAGLFYFNQLFNDANFWRVFQNTVIISVGKLIFSFPLPIITALLLNEFRSTRLKRTVQTVIYLPRFLSWVIFAGIMYNMFAMDAGAINQWLRANGHETINILANSGNFRGVLIVTSMIKLAGWNSIIYMATIAGIDTSMYEAAVVDGAGRWSQIFHITLPSILPTVCIMFIMNMGLIMNAGFDQVLALYNPAVYSVGDIIDTYVYRKGLIDAKYSYSAAAGLFKSCVGFLLVVITNFAIKSTGQESLY